MVLEPFLVVMKPLMVVLMMEPLLVVVQEPLLVVFWMSVVCVGGCVSLTVMRSSVLVIECFHDFLVSFKHTCVAFFGDQIS